MGGKITKQSAAERLKANNGPHDLQRLQDLAIPVSPAAKHQGSAEHREENTSISTGMNKSASLRVLKPQPKEKSGRPSSVASNDAQTPSPQTLRAASNVPRDEGLFSSDVSPTPRFATFWEKTSWEKQANSEVSQSPKLSDSTSLLQKQGVDKARLSLEHAIPLITPDNSALTSQMRHVRVKDRKREQHQPLGASTYGLLNGYIMENFGLDMTESEARSVADLLKNNEHIPSTHDPAFKSIVEIVLELSRKPAANRGELHIEPGSPGSNTIVVQTPKGKTMLKLLSVQDEENCKYAHAGSPPAKSGAPPQAWTETPRDRTLSNPLQSMALHQRSSRRKSLRLFLSYRVNADSTLVEKIYWQLKARDVDVWWDTSCLEKGQNWENGFADGLFSSDVFVPFLSKNALSSCSNLTRRSACDNVVLEYQLAMELRHRGALRAIYPVFLGEHEEMANAPGNFYGNFFQGGGMPSCREEVVDAIESKFHEHILRRYDSSPCLPSLERSVGTTLQSICEYQGFKFNGIESNVLKILVNELVSISKIY